jgi:uncharacterized protein (DUF2141 family)
MYGYFTFICHIQYRKMKIPYLFFLLIEGLIALNGRTQTHNHTIVFGNLDKKKGKLFIGWYVNADDFLKEDKAVLKKIVEVSDKESIPVVFENVLPGTYAVAVFFDVNGNGKMDTNFLGIPKEKYGFSNNVYPLTRAANFKESSFSITGKEEVSTIRLK